MQKRVSRNKAVSFDGFSDNWIHYTERSYYLKNLWNNQSIKILGEKIFEARVIPLNKVWP